ncbi:MAG TPA: immunoglobulin domain-containing protein, partial [Lacunisphaera sp.]|nr:immunoglobulin domain-containing protein [Lacunisphaera sp.]
MKPANLLRAVAKALSVAALSLALPTLQAAPQLLPGVYGYGLDRDSNPAGFGATSRIVHVTTLEDNGNDTTPTPGSLRAAVKVNAPRVIVFDVSGVIELQKQIVIRNPNVTIAGQTAPSPGIALHGMPFVIATSNVLVQHLRVRPGDRWLPNPDTHNRDGIDVDPGNSTSVVQNVVIDHCTFAWSLDEIASTWNGWGDVTFNKCIFAEPLHISIHLDEDTLSGEVPKQVEGLAVTPVNFGDPVVATHAAAVNGNYREWEAAGDGATLEFTVPIVAATNQSTGEHMVIGGITGPDRASFKVEVRKPDGGLLQESEVFDQYAPTNEALTFVARRDTGGFNIPIGTTSLTVKLTVMGRNPASTGWKVGLDLFSFSQNHAMGPLFASGKAGTGRLTFNGSVIAHILERGPWANARHFVFANNVLYNRKNRFVMLGNSSSWTDPIHTAIVGNTFIDGRSFGTSPRSPIARVTPPAGTQIYEAGNFYDPGDRTNAAPMLEATLEPMRVTSDPTEPGHGLEGFVPQSAADGYREVLLSAGARPNDRDIMETRVMNDIAVGATLHALADRPGTVKNSVAEAGGWPVYAVNLATWTLPANPNDDDDSDGYTNIEEWLQQLSAQLEGTPASGNNYQAEFAQLGGGSTIVTNALGANGTGFVTGPADATLTFNRVDADTGGARLLRIRYELDGAAQGAEVVVNGAAQPIAFAPTGGTGSWTLLDVPVTLTSGNNVVMIRGGGAGLPHVDDFTVTGTDFTGPVVTVPADIVTDATGPEGAVVTFAVSATDAVDGAITPTVTPPSGSTFAPGVTTVQVSATDASDNTTTRDFTVTVVAHAPAISTAPAAQAVTAGDTVTFSVVASGTPELAYQWFKDGSPLEGASGATLSLPSVTTASAGAYAVSVTNSFGTVTSASAALVVNKAPVAVNFNSLSFSYSGGPKPATVTTQPDGLTVVVTYNGSPTPPTL